MSAPTLEVACAARRDYLPHVSTMLCSLLLNSGPARIHLLIGDDVRASESAAIEAMVRGRGGSIALHRPDAEGTGIAALKSTGTLPTSHWYRVLLPELLELDRILYLDGDLIVLEPLQPLFELELGERWLAAVTNPFPDTTSAERLCRALGVELGAYFNSGVMLLDLKRLRSEGASRKVIRFARDNPDLLVLPEQDAMNAVLAGRRLELEPRWNSMHGVARFEWSEELFGAEARTEAIENPAIRHFEGSGPNKPWHPEAAAEDLELYERYRRHTPWPDPAQRLAAR